MSRRKQSNPRQIKRSLGDMEAGEEVQLVGASHTEQKAIAPEAPSPPSADELEPVVQDGQRRIRARLSLATGLSWGPFHGSVQTRASSPRQAEPMRKLRLQDVKSIAQIPRIKQQREN
ncbi:ZFPM1 isoform 4 [Pan troglodytes]|uniref:ZFPM1 isoform 4 n=1 Tax=Pan troglodytes TaxID=9598 RepID=A0A2J8IWD3_PANTR|nr:ZFPM1 isoform 4 [Pan troglodytes]